MARYDDDDPVDPKILEELLSDMNLPEMLKDASREDVADYIAGMLVEIRKMALVQDMRFLVYLLEMAFQEAYKQAHPNELEAA